ncbi:folate-binding protein YgfZ [Nanchangia anserum]|uniref:CAF17-like 4Fe-4S cluster assembly/insertion protein YgfZ n=1 Tax=Nanchangia anserum TaxID=2692125 RepID=UPI00188369C9|nr:folate-binding protein YgfZ [Nanchangia anserum]QOX81640.1 folate-binding protein YgfZ [Nanchangia anserum]
MMTLPDDLPPSLYPLAWLLGSWRGWGTAPAMGEEGEDRPLVFALDVTHDGDDLRHHLRVSYAEAADGIDVMADAARGLALLTPRDEAWEETGTWHLTRSEPAQGPGTETFGEGTLRLRGGRFGGEGLWAIRCQGPASARASATLTASVRMAPASSRPRACTASSAANSCGPRSRPQRRGHPPSRHRPPGEGGRVSHPDYLDIIDDPAGEQHALATGAGIVVLDDRDTVSVTGPNRLTWLTTLSSQIVTDIGEESRELLLLDAQGHIAHAAGVIDDGETTWLLTDAGRGPALAAFLESMRFLLRVEVAERSTEVCQLGMSAAGPLRAAIEQLRGEGVIGIWDDPWPGVCPGERRIPISPTTRAPTGPRRSCLLSENGPMPSPIAPASWPPLRASPVDRRRYVVAAPRRVGRAAWEARRIATYRPRLDREVDERALAHELDWLRTAVHLDKGCYCGQETVARIVNLGRPPRRLVHCEFDGSDSLLPPPGAAIEAAGRAIGTVTSAARDAWDGPVGLGLVKRSARAGEASVTWEEDGHSYAVAATLTPIVSPDGRAAASPETRPGRGMARVAGAAEGMRLGGI